MRRSQLLAGLALSLPVLLGLFACASTKESEGLTNVDDLLTRVEQVQIESVVAREKASAAFDALGAIVAPDFHGDPMAVYADLVEKISQSKDQARKLESSVEPMKRTADVVFQSWTQDLEKFGNTNLRQHSQSRLAETRARYSAVHDAAVAALVSINAFNADLSDQALFLEHDFNAAAVAVIASEVPALTSQARDLGRRLSACVSTSKDYINSSALRGQVDAPPPGPASPTAKSPSPAPASKLPNPMSEPEGDGAQVSTPGAVTAPARRRPRTSAPAGETPASAGSTPVVPASNGSQIPVSQVSKPLPVLPPQAPKPETDLTPPAKPDAGGNR